jgi:WD40 repeat protein/serine/threonine protein kinase
MNRDTNLLFGILALQMDFLSRDALIAAMQSQVLNKDVSLGTILLDQGTLTPERHALLSSLVSEHLKAHGEDAHQSLCAVQTRTSIVDEVERAIRTHERQDPNATTAPATLPAGTRFQIVRPLGRGGLGEVFVAVDAELNREVALKQIQERFADDAENQRRFLLEGEVTGGLEHPSIVPVYSLGRYDDGRPYYAMRFIRGETLEDVIDRYHRPHHEAAGREAVKLHNLLRRFLDVCNAVAYAHSKGWLHRDLKPSNIMLGTYGETLLLDWGLAKHLGGSTDESLGTTTAAETRIGLSGEGSSGTQQGQALGTPAYMSPEQAAGQQNELSPASDVYGLGATLYHLLTGKAAFTGGDVGAILRNVERGAFPHPRTVNSHVHPVLEAICLKCMALKPEDRYPNAKALAAEIENWLADEKVSVHRDSWLTEMRRWGRRHPRLAAAGVALAGIAVAVLIVSLIFLGREERRQQAARKETEKRKEELRVRLYYSQIGQIQGELSIGNPAFVGELLDGCDSDLRGWEWHYLRRRQRQGRTRPLVALPKGTMVNDLAWSPNGRIMATALASGAVILTDAVTRKELRRLAAPRLFFLPQAVVTVAFHPDGKLLAGAISSGTAGETTIWDVESGRQVQSLKGHKGGVVGVAYSPDGKLLASSGWDGTVRLWDPVSGSELRTLRGHENIVFRIAFHPDGKRLASGSWDGTVRIWDVTTGEQLDQLEEGVSEIWAMAYSRDGRRLATGNLEGVVHLWDGDTGKAQLHFPAQNGVIQNITFNRDGTRLAVAGWDRTIKLCDPDTGEDVLTLRGHTDLVQALAFSPDGLSLGSSGWDGNVLLWDARPLLETPEKKSLDGHESMITGLAIDSTGQRLATTSLDRTVRVWNAESGQEMQRYRGHRSLTFAVAFGPDNQHIVSGGFDEVRVWDPATAQDVTRFTGQKGTCMAVAYSPDGRRIASCAGIEGSVKVWDASTAKQLLSFDAHFLGTTAIVFSPNGKYLATGGTDRTVKVWDAETGDRVHILEGHKHIVQGVAFSADSKMLASGSWDQTIKLWDVKSGKELRSITGHENRIVTVAFSPDGKRVASASHDGTAKVWDVATGKELFSFSSQRGIVLCVAFSPDGNTLATGGGHRNKGEVKLWDLK